MTAVTCAPAAAQTGLSADMSALSPSVINAGGAANVTITLGNGTPSAVSNLGDTVVMPTGITVTTPAPTTNCPDGTMSTIGSNTVRIAGASLDSSDICTFTFRITSSTPGEYTLNPGTPSATGVSGHAGTTFTFTVNSTSPPTLHDFTASAVAYNSTGTSINVATGTTPTDSPTSWGVTTTLGGTQSAGPLTTANGGTVSINTSSGVASYAAPTGFRGNDTFFVRASNGNGPSNGATVTVPVNNPTLAASMSTTTAPAGVPLSGVAINVTGGRAPYSCATTPASGALPPGVTIAADCTLTSTPGVAGPYNFTATITDSSLGTGPYTQASGTLTLMIQPGALVVTSGPASGTQVGASYSQVNSASGGTAPYTYGLASGALPAGVALNTNTGLVSGTPSAAGAFTYVVKATDSQGTPATANGTPVTGTIAKGAQTISFTGPPTTPLSAATVSVSATATSGLGVIFTSTTTPVCTVAGTTVTLLTTGTCTIAADQAGNANTDAAPQVIRSFTVSAAAVVVAAGAASGTQVAASYSQANPASGGIAPYSYAVASGALPAGTTLNTGTGLVSGTPTTAGSFTYAIKATDSQGTPATATGATVTGSIAKGAQTINFTGPPTTPLAAGTVNVTATATSGLGVTFTSTTTPVCTVAGTTVTLLTAGTCTIAADQAGNANYNAAPQVIRSFTVGAATLVVTAGPVSGAQVAASYSQANPASGGVAPYTYAVASGAVPAGTTLNTNTGLVSGTPTTAGSVTYAIKATDSQGTPATATGATISGSIAKGTQTISFTGPPTTPLAAATVSLTATSTSGLGVTFTSTTTPVCTVAGTKVTLLTAGTCSIAADQAGNANYNAALQVAQSFTVSAATLVVAAGAASGTQVAAGYSQANPASGGTAPYTYALASGTLPAGTSLNTGTGVVSGTPTTAGAFSYAIKATDSQGPPATATGSTVSGTIAKGTQTISFTAPPSTFISASPVSISATSTSGLTVAFTSTTSAVCTVSGTSVTLLTAGTCSIAADQAGDANWSAASQAVRSFTVNAAPVVVFTPPAGALPGGVVATSYSQSIGVSGGTAPYTYSIISGALPGGLSLNTATGAITGSPTAAGSFSFTVSARDANNQTGNVAYTIGVTAPSVIAVSSNVSVIAGTTFTVDLTVGAVGGPFTSAQLISLSPPSAGTVLITLGDTASNSDTVVAALVAGGRYLLKFTSAATFTGTAVATFTLSSAFGTSAPATITFSVSPRADPSKDTEVLGVVNAQAQAAQHFASTQIMNFNDRLERLHDSGCHQNSFNLSLNDNRYQRDTDPLQRAGISNTKPQGNKDFDKLWGNDSAGRDGSGNVSASGSGGAMAPGAGNAGLPGLGASTDSRNTGSRDGVGRAGKREPKRDKQPTGCGDEAVQRFAAWTGGAVTFGRLSNATGTGASYVSTGVSAGVDYWFSPAFIGGVGFGYGQDRSAIGTSGTISNATGYSAAVYGSWHPSRSTFVDAVLGYGLLNFSSSRYITGSNGEFADGSRSGHQIFGSLTSGYEYKANGLLVSPYARFTASWSTLNAFTESSGGAFALQYGSQSVNSFTGGVGLRALYEIRQSWGAITPRMRIEYAHEFDGVSRTTVGYADLSSSSYLLQIAPTGSDYVITGLGTDLSFAGGWTLGLDYRTAFGQGKTSPQTLQMKLDARF